jgi:hypothetical protein
MRSKSAQIAIRIEPDVLPLIDQVTELVAKQSITGEAPPKAEVMRAALRKGLEQMLAELKRGKRK